MVFSCKKDDFQWNLKKAPEIGNLSILSNDTSGFQLNAECLSIGYDKDVEMGFCWSTTSEEPTLEESVIIISSKKACIFSTKVAWTYAAKYYIRAFVKNSITTIYSKSMIVIWPGNSSLPTIETVNISEISFYSMKVNCAIVSSYSQPILSEGIYLSTNSNPNSSNSIQIFNSNDAFNVFSQTFSSLTDNTTYYARAFVRTLAGEGLGNVLNVTLPKKYMLGEIGPAGGLIFYENPAIFDSWHYLEAANIDFLPSLHWSPITDQSNVVSTLLGSGVENTNSIVGIYGSSSNYASLHAYYSTYSGFSDWVLPSFEELKLMKVNLFDNDLGGFSEGSTYWSSSEDESYYQNAWTVNMNNTGINMYTSQPKSLVFRIRCIRRF
jgi:hypothetical protein